MTDHEIIDPDERRMEIFIKLGMQHIFINKLQFNTSNVKDKCMELMSIEWHNDVSNKPKLRTNRTFKQRFGTENYVKKNTPKPVRSRFSQFRIGILPIRIDTGRFETILDQQTGVLRKLNVNERACNICSSGPQRTNFIFCFDALCMIGKGLTFMIDATELYQIFIP